MRERLTRQFTIRLSGEVEARLERRARQLGTTASELARGFIAAGLDGCDTPTAGALVGHLLGSISSKTVPAGRDAKRALASAVSDRRT